MVYLILKTEELSPTCTDTLIRMIQEWPGVTGFVLKDVKGPVSNVLGSSR